MYSANSSRISLSTSSIRSYSVNSTVSAFVSRNSPPSVSYEDTLFTIDSSEYCMRQIET